MKNLKKLWLNLAALAIFAMVSFILSGRVLADSTTSGPASIKVGNTTYTASWIDRSNIQINATTAAGKTTSTTLTDSSWANGWTYTSPAPKNGECGSMTMSNFGNAIVGMTPQDTNSPSANWSQADSYGTFTVENTTCNKVIDNKPIKIGNWQNASISFKATDPNTIQIVDQAQSQTFSNPRLQNDGTVRYYQDGQLGDICQVIIAVNFNNKTINQYFTAHQMEYFNQKTDGTYASPISSNCKLNFIASHLQGMANTDTISAYAFPIENFSTLKKPSSVQAGNGSGAGSGQSTGTSTTTCYTASATGFEWLFCPVLNIMDSLAGTFTGIIENLLNFNTNQYLNPQVKNSWSIFKNIASALLVIIMLIAVISQAIGGGPVDAYTLRKILPRLVAAVIIMQLSWVMLTWFIELANDLGHGVRDLISAPFGGWGNLDLEHLVAGLGGTGTISQAALFTSLGIAFVFSGLTIGGLLLIAVSVILTCFLAFALLLLRQVFIVASVILFPVAILCWILPGTQRYWKLWQDNFIKLLMLFPLIMALIYGGRIFAHIFITAAGSSDTDKAIATLVMFIAFFGPYWFLPRAFRWGGQLYGAASNAALNATQSARSFPRKYAMGAAKENRVRRGELRAERLAANPNNRSFRDRLLAGEFNLAKSRGRGGQLGAREMDFAKTLAAGEKESREGVPAQLLRVGYDSWRHGPALNARGERILEGQEGYEINKLDALQAWLEGRTYAGITPDAALRGHAFDTLATLGDPDRIRLARQNSEIPEEIWSKAVARNFPKLNEIARYLTLTPDLSGLAVRQFTTQDDDTALELERQLEGHYVYDRETGGRTEQTDEEHRAALQRAANLARDARNPLIWVDLGETKKQVIARIEELAAREGITGVDTGGGPRTATPTEPPEPPPPPAGPGAEGEEAVIQVDHEPGT